MIIDERLKEIISIIEDLGHNTLIVGGAVRNHLLNRDVIDYDLATSAKIKDLAEVFLNSTMIYRQDTPWALKINHKGFVCEISTFRIEKDYKNRIPQKITYVKTFKEDVLRRDFTINALGYCLNGEIVDYCQGLEDLENKLVRSIKDPRDSFLEDEMRILRGLRLASTLNFTIEKSTLIKMQDLYKNALDSKSDIVSRELKRIIAGSNFDYVYNNFTNLFMDISNKDFKNIELYNREVLLSDDYLYTYFKFNLNFLDSNPIYQYININERTKVKINKLEPLFKELTSSLNLSRIELLTIDYGLDQITYVIDCLDKVELLPKTSLSNFNTILKKGYFKISDLSINVNDLDFVPTIKERYKILERLQKMVVEDKLVNKRACLLEKSKELFNKEKS